MSLSQEFDAVLTQKQLELMVKHGTPAEFARAAYDAVPVWISMAEAADAVKKYQQEWDAAEIEQSPVNNPEK